MMFCAGVGWYLLLFITMAAAAVSAGCNAFISDQKLLRVCGPIISGGWGVNLLAYSSWWFKVSACQCFMLVMHDAQVQLSWPNGGGEVLSSGVWFLLSSVLQVYPYSTVTTPDETYGQVWNVVVLCLGVTSVCLWHQARVADVSVCPRYVVIAAVITTNMC